MSLSVLGDLNWLAVLVATIAYFALGALWYAEFAFGKAWQRAVGWDLTHRRTRASASTPSRSSRVSWRRWRPR